MEHFQHNAFGTLFSSLYALYEQEFSLRVSELEAHFEAEAVKNLLQDVHNFNKDSMLSYTASPKSPLNQKIFNLARRLAQQTNLHPVHFLLPGISTESIQTPTRDQIVFPNLDSADLPLETLFSEYISGDPGTAYLIPVKILAECSIHGTTNAIPNYYCDFTLCEEQRGSGYLTATEVERLYDFSSQTRQIWELRQNYADLLQSDLSLLAQLNLLLKNMRFNSIAYGHGTELDAGLGAYLALIRFLEYYKPLSEQPNFAVPEEIGAEIQLLFNLTSDPTVNTNATEQIQTCMSLRYERLSDLIQSHKESLAKISPEGTPYDQEETPSSRIVREYEVARQELLSHFQEGQDPLGISMSLLELCQENIQVHSESDLHRFLISCPEQKYAQILNSQSSHRTLRHSILEVLGENNLDQLIPQLVILLVHLQPQKGKSFLKAFPEIQKALREAPSAFSEVLQSFEGEKFQAIVEGLSPDLLVYYLENSEELEDPAVLSLGKKGSIEKEISKLADWVRDLPFFLEVAPLIEDQEQSRQFVEAVGFEKLASFGIDSSSFGNISSNLKDQEQSRKFVEAVGFEKLASFAIDSSSFGNISSNLKDQEQSRKFVEALSFEKLASFAIDSSSFRNISSSLKQKDQDMKLLEKLSERIIDFKSLLKIVCYLSYGKEKEEFIEIVGFEKLAHFATDNNSFQSILFNLSKDQKLQFVEQVGFEKLACFATDNNSFQFILSNLSKNQQLQFIEQVGFEKLVYLAIDMNSFTGLISAIRHPEKKRQFVEQVGLEKLASWAIDGISFKNIASKLNDEALNRQFVEQVGLEKLVSWAAKHSLYFRFIISNISDETLNRQFLEKMILDILKPRLIDPESLEKEQFDITLNIVAEMIEYRKNLSHGREENPNFQERGLEPFLLNKKDLSRLLSVCEGVQQNWLISQLSLETLVDVFKAVSKENQNDIFEKSTLTQKTYLLSQGVIENNQNLPYSSTSNSLYSSSHCQNIARSDQDEKSSERHHLKK